MVAACAPQAPAANAATEPAPQSGLKEIPLVIQTDKGTRNFTVEVAATGEEQEIGLMFRRHLAPNSGMIFPYQPAQDVAFWMKNTLIPLDLIFVRSDHRIARIAENAVPLSLEPIPSGEPVIAVVEIGGGRSRALGIEPGDAVNW